MNGSTYTVIWDGTLHRRYGEAYSLLPDFPAQKEDWYAQAIRAGHNRDGLIGRSDLRRAKTEPVNMAWRTYDPEKSEPKPQPPVQSVRCRACGQRYKTRIPGQRRICGRCRGKVGRPRAAA